MGLFALFGVLLLLSACVREKSAAQNDRRLGIDPIDNIVLADSESESFLAWARRGAGHAKTLVHIGNRDGLGFIPDEKLDSLRAHVKKEAWDEIEKLRDAGDRGLFSSSNYIYASARLGLIDQVYWVIPYQYPEYYNAEIMVRTMLRNGATRFRDRDIDGMKYRQGCVSGKLFDTAVHICSVDTLPRITEAVLIDIDADFLPPFASDKGASPLRALKQFADSVKVRELKVESVRIVHSGDDSMARAIRRYVAEELAAVFADPKLMAGDVPPELWKYRDGAESRYIAGQPRELLKFLEAPLVQHPDDQTLVAFHGLALIDAGRERQAFSELAGLCERVHASCDPMLAAVQKLIERGKKDLAGQFIEAALRIRPDWNEGLEVRAMVRSRQAMYREALADFRKMSARFDSMTLQWRIADCYYFLGRQDDAVVHYKQGIAFWHELRSADDLADMAGARDRMLELARKKNEPSLTEAVQRIFGAPASPDRT